MPATRRSAAKAPRIDDPPAKQLVLAAWPQLREKSPSAELQAIPALPSVLESAFRPPARKKALPKAEAIARRRELAASTSRKVLKDCRVTKYSATYPTTLEDWEYRQTLALMTRAGSVEQIGDSRKPGSDAARQRGCKCDPAVNQYGAGFTFGDSPLAEPSYQVHPECDLHRSLR